MIYIDSCSIWVSHTQGNVSKLCPLWMPHTCKEYALSRCPLWHTRACCRSSSWGGCSHLCSTSSKNWVMLPCQYGTRAPCMLMTVVLNVKRRRGCLTRFTSAVGFQTEQQPVQYFDPMLFETIGRRWLTHTGGVYMSLLRCNESSYHNTWLVL